MICMHRDDSDQPANLPSLFVCVEVLRPSQQQSTAKVMSSRPSTLFLGRLRPTKRLAST